MAKRRAHALLLAIVLWTVAVLVAFVGTGYRSFAGPLKGADFVQFYTMGYLARTGEASAIYDTVALHHAQATLVPESADLIYPPVYPPQTALIFAPLTVWSYGMAALAWTGVTVCLYGFIVWRAWQPVRDWLDDSTYLAVAAAAFPPFWQLVLNGQTTIVILAAFYLGWISLERHRSFAAGCAFGLLAIKPQFGIPLVAIVLARRQWMMMWGAIASVGAQALVAWAVLGSVAFSGYARMLPIVLAHADLLEPKPFQSHSLRALTRIAPTWVGLPLWLGASAIVLWYTVRIWHPRTSLRMRLSAVIVAAVLVNPHLIVYDATVLVLPLLWFGGWLQEHDRNHSAAYWTAVYGLFVTLLVPTAAYVGLQISVVILMWIFFRISRASLAHSQPLLPRLEVGSLAFR